MSVSCLCSLRAPDSGRVGGYCGRCVRPAPLVSVSPPRCGGVSERTQLGVEQRLRPGSTLHGESCLYSTQSPIRPRLGRYNLVAVMAGQACLLLVASKHRRYPPSWVQRTCIQALNARLLRLLPSMSRCFRIRRCGVSDRWIRGEAHSS